MDPIVSRRIWHGLEAINAVSYFTPESIEAAASTGMKGFWMGYFGFRAAPLGEVGPGVVEATFANFHPSRVRRALPDAWSHMSAADLLIVRSTAASDALRRILGDTRAFLLSEAVLPLAHEAIGHADGTGRTLFSANRDVPPLDDPVSSLWQAATTLREHRGDAHVALLIGAGLGGCESHVLFTASEGVEPALYLRSRGWSSDDWEAAVERLAARGLVNADGSITTAGRALRDRIEHETDMLAVRPYEAIGSESVARLLAALEPAARRIARSGDVTFPNPMGLPRPSTD